MAARSIARPWCTDHLLGLLRALYAHHRDAAGRAAMVYRTAVYVWDRTP